MARLAVVAPLLKQTGLADTIDRHVPADPQAEFADGRILSVPIAPRPYGSMPICGHTIDGNQNGRTAVHEQTELPRKLLSCNAPAGAHNEVKRLNRPTFP
jgi:hypothetical protein